MKTSVLHLNWTISAQLLLFSIVTATFTTSCSMFESKNTDKKATVKIDFGKSESDAKLYLGGAGTMLPVDMALIIKQSDGTEITRPISQTDTAIELEVRPGPISIRANWLGVKLPVGVTKESMCATDTSSNYTPNYATWNINTAPSAEVLNQSNKGGDEVYFTNAAVDTNVDMGTSDVQLVFSTFKKLDFYSYFVQFVDTNGNPLPNIEVSYINKYTKAVIYGPCGNNGKDKQLTDANGYLQTDFPSSTTLDLGFAMAVNYGGSQKIINFVNPASGPGAKFQKVILNAATTNEVTATISSSATPILPSLIGAQINNYKPSSDMNDTRVMVELRPLYKLDEKSLISVNSQDSGRYISKIECKINDGAIQICPQRFMWDTGVEKKNYNFKVVFTDIFGNRSNEFSTLLSFNNTDSSGTPNILFSSNLDVNFFPANSGNSCNGTNVTANTVCLKWPAASNKPLDTVSGTTSTTSSVISYKIYRSVNIPLPFLATGIPNMNPAIGVREIGWVNGMGFQDTDGIAYGSKYYYTVCAVNAVAPTIATTAGSATSIPMYCNKTVSFVNVATTTIDFDFTANLNMVILTNVANPNCNTTASQKGFCLKWNPAIPKMGVSATELKYMLIRKKDAGPISFDSSGKPLTVNTQIIDVNPPNNNNAFMYEPESVLTNNSNYYYAVCAYTNKVSPPFIKCDQTQMNMMYVGSGASATATTGPVPYIADFMRNPLGSPIWNLNWNIFNNPGSVKVEVWRTVRNVGDNFMLNPTGTCITSSSNIAEKCIAQGTNLITITNENDSPRFVNLGESKRVTYIIILKNLTTNAEITRFSHWANISVPGAGTPTPTPNPSVTPSFTIMNSNVFVNGADPDYSGIDLTWNNAVLGITNTTLNDITYKIFRKDSGDFSNTDITEPTGYSQVFTLPANVFNFYDITDLITDTTYNYRLCAYVASPAYMKCMVSSKNVSYIGGSTNGIHPEELMIIPGTAPKWNVKWKLKNGNSLIVAQGNYTFNISYAIKTNCSTSPITADYVSISTPNITFNSGTSEWTLNDENISDNRIAPSDFKCIYYKFTVVDNGTPIAPDYPILHSMVGNPPVPSFDFDDSNFTAADMWNGNTEIRLTWAAPTSPVNLNMTNDLKYKIFRKNGADFTVFNPTTLTADTNWAQDNITSSQLSFIDNNSLVDSVAYHYRICAYTVNVAPQVVHCTPTSKVRVKDPVIATCSGTNLCLNMPAQPINSFRFEFLGTCDSGNGNSITAQIIPAHKGRIEFPPVCMTNVLKVVAVFPAGSGPISIQVNQAAATPGPTFNGDFYFNKACPAGYVAVPGLIDPSDPANLNGIGNVAALHNEASNYGLNPTKDFCVMKYPAKATEGGIDTVHNGASANAIPSPVPMSVSEGTPWINVSRNLAQDRCKFLNEIYGHCVGGGCYTGFDNTKFGYRLITNTEWQVIARNIEGNKVNWSDNNVGAGVLNKGHSDSGNDGNSLLHAQATAAPGSLTNSKSDANGYFGTGNAPGIVTTPAPLWNTLGVSPASGAEQKRTHELNNGEIIWDYSGNIWQWMFEDSDAGMGSSGYVRGGNSLSEYDDASLTAADKLIFSSISNLISAVNAGQIYRASGLAIARGGAFNSGTSAGIYSANLGSDATTPDLFHGFRCVFLPPENLTADVVPPGIMNFQRVDSLFNNVTNDPVSIASGGSWNFKWDVIDPPTPNDTPDKIFVQVRRKSGATNSAGGDIPQITDPVYQQGYGLNRLINETGWEWDYQNNRYKKLTGAYINYLITATDSKGNKIIDPTLSNPGRFTVQVISSCPPGYVGISPYTLDSPSGLGSVSASSGNGDKQLDPTLAFCVMKYPAKVLSANTNAAQNLVGGILEPIYKGSSINQTYGGSYQTTIKYIPDSRASGTPWVNISRNDSIEACNLLDNIKDSTDSAGQFKLISNTEWQVIARDIENIGANWTGNAVNNGVIIKGHSDNLPNNILANSNTDSNSYFGTDNNIGEAYNTGRAERRIHILSNGQIIWDMGGNLLNWVKDDIGNVGLSSPAQAIPASFTELSTGSFDGSDQKIFSFFGTGYGSNGLYAGGPSSLYLGSLFGAASYNSANGIKRGNNVGNAGGGIFGANWWYSPTAASSDTGFRCVYIP